MPEQLHYIAYSIKLNWMAGDFGLLVFVSNYRVKRILSQKRKGRMEGVGVNRIQLFKEDVEVACPEGDSILQATLAAQLNHSHACGGRAKCSTCRVSITSGIENCDPRNKAEELIASKLKFPAEVRLACQTRINGDVSIRRMVSDKLDMDMIAEQFSGDSKAALGSQQKLTIVFTDIANYTGFAEKFPPYDIVYVLNRYYRIMNEVIQDHQGIISDVAGDGILAVFGLDENGGNSVSDAINAVRGMNQKLKLFNEYLQANFNMEFKIRVGIHYGNVIVGSFDFGSMKKVAVIGDNVNYASRIESANKEFGTTLLLSDEAYQEIRSKYPKYNSFSTTLKGKTGKYTLYEIV